MQSYTIQNGYIFACTSLFLAFTNSFCVCTHLGQWDEKCFVSAFEDNGHILMHYAKTATKGVHSIYLDQYRREVQ